MFETFLILRRIQCAIIINVHRSSGQVPVTLLQFSQQIFEKYSNIKFHETPSFGIRVMQCMSPWKQADMLKPIAALHNFANATKIVHFLSTWSKIYPLSPFNGFNWPQSLLWRKSKFLQMNTIHKQLVNLVVLSK